MKLNKIFLIGILLVFTANLQAVNKVGNNPENVKIEEKEISFEDFLNWETVRYGNRYYSTEADFFYRLGLFHSEQENVETAIKAYHLALGSNPDEWLLPSIYFNLGMLYDRQENYEMAVKYLNMALEATPKNDIGLFYIYFTLGEIYTFQKNYEKAIESYNNALNLRVYQEFPDFIPAIASIYFDLGFIASEKQDYKQAIKYTQKAIKLDPNFAEAYGSLSYYLLFKKQFKQSEKMARKGLLLDESQEWIYTNLVASLLFQGRYSEAVNYYTSKLADIEGEKKSILEDLDQYEKANIIPKKRKADVEKLKKTLKNDN